MIFFFCLENDSFKVKKGLRNYSLAKKDCNFARNDISSKTSCGFARVPSFR